MKDKIKRITERVGKRNFISLLIVTFIVFVTLISWTVHEITRPLDLRDLDPSEYADNQELMKFAEDLKNADDPTDILMKYYSGDSIANDRRHIDILILCMHERESTISKIFRFFNDIGPNFSISNLSSIPATFMGYMDQDNKDEIRQNALFRLCYKRDAGVPAINEVTNLLLNDPSMSVRQEAFKALGCIGSSESFPLMIKLIKDDYFKGNVGAKSLASNLRGVINNEEQVNQIVKYLDGNNEQLRITCLKVLARLRINYPSLTNKVIYLLQNDPSVKIRTECVEWVNMRMGKKAYPYILKAFKEDPSDTVRAQCIYNFRWISSEETHFDEVIDIIVQVLKNSKENTLVRINAVNNFTRFGKWEIEQIKTKGVPKLLLKIANDTKEPTDLRDVCIEGLSSLSDKDTASDLLEILELKYKMGTLKRSDIHNISSIKSPKSIDLLLKIYNNKKYLMHKYEIMHSLGNESPERALDTLLELLKKEKNHGVCQTLSKIKDDRVIEPLIEAMKEMDESLIFVKGGIIYNLSWSDSPKLKEYIYSFLRGKRSNRGDREIFNDICWHYHKWLKEDEAFDLIVEIAQSSEEVDEVRSDAILGMERSKNPRAKHVMLEILNNEGNPVAVRLSAAENLLWRKEYIGLELILNSLKDDNPKIRHHALGSLFQFNDDRIIPALKEMADNEKNLELKAKIETSIERRKKREDRLNQKNKPISLR